MAYRDFKDLSRRIAPDKLPRDKPIDLTKYPKYDGYDFWLALTSIVYKFFGEKSATHAKRSAATHIGTCISSNADFENQQLVE